EVATRDDRLGAPTRELVEGGDGLGDQRRLSQPGPRQAGSEGDVLGLRRGGGEQQPHVLVPCLVGGVAGVEAELVGQFDRRQRLRQRGVGAGGGAVLQGDPPSLWIASGASVVPLGDSASSSATSSAPDTTRSGKWRCIHARWW